MAGLALLATARLNDAAKEARYSRFFTGSAVANNHTPRMPRADMCAFHDHKPEALADNVQGMLFSSHGENHTP